MRGSALASRSSPRRSRPAMWTSEPFSVCSTLISSTRPTSINLVRRLPLFDESRMESRVPSWLARVIPRANLWGCATPMKTSTRASRTSRGSMGRSRKSKTNWNVWAWRKPLSSMLPERGWRPTTWVNLSTAPLRMRGRTVGCPNVTADPCSTSAVPRAPGDLSSSTLKLSSKRRPMFTTQLG